MPREIPPHAQAWLDRPTLIEVGKRPVDEALRPFRAALRTFADARRLFDGVAARLGDRALVEVEKGPQRWLYLRDPERPDHVLMPALIEERGWGAIELGAAPPRVVPGSDMHAGELDLHDGDGRVRFVYDDGGVLRGIAELGGDAAVMGWQSTTRGFAIDRGARPPTPPIYSLLLRDDHGGELSVETLIEWIAELPPRREHTARVTGASEVTCCSWGAINRVCPSLSNRLWAQPPGPDDRWLAVDGLWGRAGGLGPTADIAAAELGRDLWTLGAALLDPEAGALPFDLAAWLPETDEPDNMIPFPVARAEGTEVISVGERMSFSFGPFISLHEWPRSISALPSVLVPIPPRPATPAALAKAGFEPVCVAGPDATLRWVFRRLGRDPLIIIGGGVADCFGEDLDLDSLEDDMREADRRHRADVGDEFDLMSGPSPWTTHYRIWNARTHRPHPPEHAGGRSSGFTPADLNGIPFDVLVTRVTARRSW